MYYLITLDYEATNPNTPVGRDIDNGRAVAANESETAWFLISKDCQCKFAQEPWHSSWRGKHTKSDEGIDWLHSGRTNDRPSESTNGILENWLGEIRVKERDSHLAYQFTGSIYL